MALVALPYVVKVSQGSVRDMKTESKQQKPRSHVQELQIMNFDRTHFCKKRASNNKEAIRIERTMNFWNRKR